MNLTNQVLTFRRVLYLLLLIAVIPVLYPLHTTAQNANPQPPANLHQWGAVTLFHGLPSDHVQAIAQDQDGTLWFGTDGGLAKFDGRRIEKIVIEELTNTRVRVLTFDLLQRLWIGTDKGAGIWSNNQFQLLAETREKSINAIAVGRNIAMVSEEGFIFSYSISTFPTHLFTISPQDNPLLNIEANNSPLPLTSVEFVSENSLIIGTRGRGLLQIEGKEIKELTINPRPFFIEAIARDPHQQFWIGAQAKDSHNGLYQLDALSRSKKINADTNTVTALKFANIETFWVGTQKDGVFVFKGTEAIEHLTFENTAGGLRSNNIYTIFFDREGVVWIGTDRGVCRFDPQGMRVETISPFAESNFIRALFQSADGLIWCGTNRGLFVRLKTSPIWQEVAELSGKSIYAMIETAENHLLVGTHSGLYSGKKDLRFTSRYFTGSRAFERAESETSPNNQTESIRAFCKFQNTIFLASFENGVDKFDGENRTTIFPVENNELGKRLVVSLFADKNGRLLIGTAEGGLFVFDGRQAIREPDFDSLKNQTIWAITQTADGALWFATNEGLSVFANGKLQHLIESVEARAVIPASNSAPFVWCATSGSGFFKVLLDERGEPIISRFDSEQGLPSQKVFAVLPTAENELWIGTNSGVVRYETNNMAPVLKISRVIGNRAYQPREIASQINLEYPQNSLLVEAAAIGSRTFPEQFQYAFVLFDSTGRLITQKISRDSQMVVQNLRNGEYRLTVRAYTNDLIASEPLTVNFAVQRAPFPWTTTALAVLLLLAILAMFWGYRQNQKIARSHEALAITNQQLAETRMQLANETETERRRISRDLHDQTLADLRKLMMLSDQLSITEKTNGHQSIDPKLFRAEIESISSEIRRICEDLSPSVLENVGFAAALEWALTEAVAHLPAENRFAYEFACEEFIEEKLNLPTVMQIHIYRIAQEAISNISRHAQASQVRLRARVDADNNFILEIEDDGCGFDLSTEEKKGRGIANIRTRASLIDAEVNWIRQSTGGTLFIFRKLAQSPISI
ncbi:MAG: two-component regulator propeller domain-containing protein [Acidobacteriota bacterium]